MILLAYVEVSSLCQLMWHRVTYIHMMRCVVTPSIVMSHMNWMYRVLTSWGTPLHSLHVHCALLILLSQWGVKTPPWRIFNLLEYLLSFVPGHNVFSNIECVWLCSLYVLLCTNFLSFTMLLRRSYRCVYMASILTYGCVHVVITENGGCTYSNRRRWNV